jgi:uncharacterized membrane protein YbhN (UPF0104 family)
MAVLRLALPLVLVTILVVRLGTDPFLHAGQVLTLPMIAAALVLGLVTSTAQALRWRVFAQAYRVGSGLTRRQAVQEYYRAAFLNTAVPGGVAGDALRVWRQQAAPPQTRSARSGRGLAHWRGRGLRAAAGSVVAERVAGTALLFAAAGTAALEVDPRLTLVLYPVAAVAAAIAVPGLVRLPPLARWAVLGWSVLAMTALVAEFALAARVLGTVQDPRQVIALGLILLAGGSIPLGFAGFGPRETVAAVAFAATGLPAAAGVATSAAFGLLAIVSVLPGAAVLLLRSTRHRTGRPVPPIREQVELDADVIAEREPPGGSTQRVPEPVGAGEPQAGNAVTDQ